MKSTNENILNTQIDANLDERLDSTLRPQTFSDFIGQEKVKKSLDVLTQAAKIRGDSLDHILIYGPPGLGKTTLAKIIANQIGANINITSGPALEKTGDLASILTNLSDGDVLFIDEIHRLNKNIEEVLYPAMEDHMIDIVVGKGPAAKTLRLDLPKFTLVGATTQVGSISSPMRDRFGLIERLNYYDDKEIEKIIIRSAKLLDISIDSEAAKELAKRSRFTPRIANRLIKRARDFAQVKGKNKISKDITESCLELMEIDSVGLDGLDRKILHTIIDKFSGGPVGLSTLSACIGEDVNTISDMYEPYLMQVGFIERTPRGRTAHPRAYKHLDIIYNPKK